MTEDEKILEQQLLENRVIDEKTSCWRWTKGKNNQGYGQIYMKGTIFKVHRLAYELWKCPIIVNNICHIRECPNKDCFNPDHLYDGTDSENRLDATANGANHYCSLKTHCPQGHKYDKENTDRISGSGFRRCKECHRQESRERYKKMREIRKMILNQRRKLANSQ